MNEQELREKIVKVLEEYRDWFIEEDYKRDIAKIDYTGIADALIEAGIGDISEWKHRAKVSQRALRNRTEQFLKLQGYANEEIRYLTLEYVIPNDLKQAEKELKGEQNENNL